jgi:hypothetical protein
MKSFFKTFFASFLGSAVLLLVVVIFIFGSLIASIASSSEANVTLKPKTVLYMNLNYDIPERTNSNSLEMYFNVDKIDMAGMNDKTVNVNVNGEIGVVRGGFGKDALAAAADIIDTEYTILGEDDPDEVPLNAEF